MFKKGVKEVGVNLELELAKAQVKNEIYEAQILELNAQVCRLQEALVAASAPKAYDQMLMARQEPPKPDPDRERKEEEERLFKQHLENIEGPTFKDADDLVSTLGALIGINAGSDSIHSNSES